MNDINNIEKFIFNKNNTFMFICSFCDYSTSKKDHFYKHLQTNKHLTKSIIDCSNNIQKNTNNYSSNRNINTKINSNSNNSNSNSNSNSNPPTLGRCVRSRIGGEG